MIRVCNDKDMEEIYLIINDSARAYKSGDSG